ncbi:sushi domain protein [Necator americanus]|uniref:Sushi domain protein n=1 Tax=Necator americanus TaxID=51031 RepID=W2SQD4_NECAM|nr:sushi domain protein [Necator americanus]ETN71091.1 sushi domain protein [Necator americanus]
MQALGVEGVDANQLTVAIAQPEDSGLLHCILPSVFYHVRDTFFQTDSALLSATHPICQYTSRDGTYLLVQWLSSHVPLGTNLRVLPRQHAKTMELGVIHRRNVMVSVICRESSLSGRAVRKNYPDICATAIQCPPLAVDSRSMLVTVSSYKFGGIAQFQCAKGLVVKCDKLEPPKNAVVLSPPKTHYHRGDVLLFGCLPNHILTGGDFVVCQSNGQWTEIITKCDAFCRHPGVPVHGASTSPPKDYYLVGEKIVFYCPSHEYRLNSENVLTCIGAGKWSRKIPLCLLDQRN